MLSVADPSGAITRLQVPLLTLLLIPVSLLPTLTGHAGRLYAALAVLMGLMFLVTAVWPNRERLDASARGTFLASIIYLPMLLGLALVDKV
jgi:protoheme IX farnesyltransferase